MINKEEKAKKRFRFICNKIDSTWYLNGAQKPSYHEDMTAGTQPYFRKHLKKLFVDLNYKYIEKTYYDIMSSKKDWYKINLFLNEGQYLSDDKIFENFKIQTYDYFKRIQIMIEGVTEDNLIRFKKEHKKGMERSLPIIKKYLENNWF